METAINVAKYILRSQDHDEPDITKLKLQKLLYYAQGFFLAKTGEPLFSDVIEAWQHGPVVPNVFSKYQSVDGNSLLIPQEEVVLDINDEEKEFLNEVLFVHGQYSGWALRQMTHEELPWKISFNQNNREISHEILKDFFQERL